MLPFIKDYLGGAFAMDVFKSLTISIVVGLSLVTAIFSNKASVLTEKCAKRASGAELVDNLSPRFRLPAWFFATTLEDDEGEGVA
ncbi:hypothetical protein CPC08DRAFT_707840 [Agrocybe pediades]|nr:hypothetical protein CPC08DRAFT_707840 [Agrocybe pediades]